MATEHRLHGERRKRRAHRRLALLSVALIAWFALTGLVLNHVTDLALGERALPAPMVRTFYAAALPAELAGQHVGGQWITVIDGVLHVGTRQAGACAGGLRGAIGVGTLFVAACDDALQVTDANGTPVERIDSAWGLGGTIGALGHERAGRRIVVVTSTGTFCLDEALTALVPCAAPMPGPTWTQRVPDDARAALAAALGEQHVDVERFLHDLHSGRLFGSAARWVWDLFALALLALAASGIVMLRRR